MGKTIYQDSARRIFVMTTYNCNLHCSYCYESSKKKIKMNVASIKAALEKEFRENQHTFSIFNLSFHGGEPFLAFVEMTELCDWLWKKYKHLDIRIGISTNGTILNQDIKNWLTKYKNKINLSLSIDGAKDVHEINRGFGSYDKIDISFFLETFPRMQAKMTVCPNTIDQLYNSFMYLLKMGFSPNPSLANEVDWVAETHIPIYIREVSKLIDFYLKNPNYTPGTLFSTPIHKYAFQNKFKQNCGACYTVIAYDIDGNKYPCHSFISNFHLDHNENNVKNIMKEIEEKSFNDLFKNCRDCFFKIVCSPCLGANYMNRGNIGSIDKRFCEFVKITVLAISKLYGSALLKKDKYIWLKEKSDLEIYNLISSVKTIQNYSR